MRPPKAGWFAGCLGAALALGAGTIASGYMFYGVAMMATGVTPSSALLIIVPCVPITIGLLLGVWALRPAAKDSGQA